MFKKETGIDIPKERMDGLTNFLRSVDIGESFVAPIRARQSIIPISNQIGIKIKTRKINNHEIRVWRLA